MDNTCPFCARYKIVSDGRESCTLRRNNDEYGNHTAGCSRDLKDQFMPVPVAYDALSEARAMLYRRDQELSRLRDEIVTLKERLTRV